MTLKITLHENDSEDDSKDDSEDDSKNDSEDDSMDDFPCAGIHAIPNVYNIIFLFRCSYYKLIYFFILQDLPNTRKQTITH